MTKSNDPAPSPHDITLLSAFLQRTLASSQTPPLPLPRESQRFAENGRASGSGNSDGQGGSQRDLRAFICAVITQALEENPDEGADAESACGSCLPPPSRRPRDDDGATN
jgi:hypothetical protein